MPRADVIRPVLLEALAPTGLVLEDVTVTAAGRRSVVRVVLDRDLDADGEVTTPTEPLSLDEVAEATRSVGDALDRTDAMGEQPYTLEVSSPGVGRPLTDPRHFRRNVGRLLTVRTGAGEVTGRVTSAGPAAMRLEVAATRTDPAHAVDVAYADVQRASVEVEFARHDDPQEN